MSVPEPPDIVDPNSVGPFGICSRCFTPESEDYSFCQNCGMIKGFFAAYVPTNAERCFVHPDLAATKTCALCGRPVCDRCVEREGVSFASGLRTPQCRGCLQKSAELEIEYLRRISEQRRCAKHFDNPSRFTCVVCNLGHCPECTYFLRRGIFTYKIRAGPYCLPCFRTTYFRHKRRRWLSGRTALDKGLVV